MSRFTREQLKGKTVTVDGKKVDDVEIADTDEGFADVAVRYPNGMLINFKRQAGKVAIADAAPELPPLPTPAE